MKVNVEGLKSRVESIDDIMTNILKAYDVSSYTEFFWHINTKKYHYNDDEDVTPEQLSTSALNKYEVLLTTRKLNSMSPEQEKILALTAEVTKLNDNNLKL